MLPVVPAALRELLTGGAEGNPFYMEELVKMLIDEGAISTGMEHWTVQPDKLLATHVPPTLTGVLQARLDRLQAEEKRVLQQASVIGSVFSEGALLAINPGARDGLLALLRHGLVKPHGEGAAEGQREFVFAHQLLHQVTYETVLKRKRKELHGQAAHWFAHSTGARANDYLGAAAEHFLAADEHLKACEYFTRAAERATERHAQHAVLEYADKGWESLLLLQSNATEATAQSPLRLLRWRLLDVREQAYDMECKRHEQQDTIDAMYTLADELREDRKRCETAWRQSNLALRTGDFHAMQSSAQATMELSERTGDPLLSLRGQQRLALALTYLGDSASGKGLAQEGLEKARLLGARALEALFL
ncbi:MAG: ATP-binding protein, partial [Rhodoferax sp.]